MTPVPVMLTEALRHHRAGHLREAEQLYRQILKSDPHHSDALHLLGLLAYQIGRNDAAEDLIRRAIAFNGRVPAFHSDLGNVQKKQGKLGEAVTSYRRALTLRPDFAESHNNLGIALAEQGELDKAKTSYRRALTLRPDYPEAHNNLGNALRDQGQLDEAAASYGRALTNRPDFAAAHNNLGVVLVAQNKPGEAAASFERALTLAPGNAETHNNLGLALAKQGRLEEAVAAYQRALTHRPDYVVAHNNLGVALREQGKAGEALVSLGKALAYRPDYAEAHNNLGNVFADQGRFAEAEASYRLALNYRPDHAETHYNLGNVLTDLNRFTEAVASYRQSLVYRPDCAETLNNLGNAMKYQGKLDEAVESCERALAGAPHGAVYLNLAELKRFTPRDPHLAAMEDLARDIGSLPVDSRIALHFALGKAYDDCEEHDRAFAHFRDGNALKRQQVVYEEAAILGLMERTRRLFDGELMAAKAGWGDPSNEPIFIVGMPRSGSSLLEQILASHPQVFGAGECRDFHHLASNLGSGRAYPEGALGLSAFELQQLARNYLARLRSVSSGAARFTDKLPINFLYAGLIHLALPNARIIHTRRDPADTCLSCFFTSFSVGQYYTFDLGDLGRYYRAYDQLMDQWRAVLPPSVLIEVDYETLVADLEGQTRRVLSHCGLDWDEACLSFHETERVVRTASAVQVREQVHNRSIGRWRKYQQYLQPLLRELGPVTRDS